MIVPVGGAARMRAVSPAAREFGSRSKVRAIRSETTPGKIRKRPATTVRALSTRAAIEKRP